MDRHELETEDHLPARPKSAARKQTRLRLVVIIASIAIPTVAALWSYVDSRYPIFRSHSAFANQDIPPGKYQAILTLANGKTIPLNDAQTGVVMDASELSYYDGSIGTNATRHLSQSATITTPRGGQYRIRLPDGTIVWLNAASSLSFSLMPGKSQIRNVELTGEAYFEVAEDSHRLFVVKTAHQVAEVLGTRFNICSYADEKATWTTLVSGSLRVVNRHSKMGCILKPGHRAVVVKDKLTVEPVDTECILAWKEGYFKFSEDENITDIMPRVARWYNVKIIYKGDMHNVNFTGTFSRFKNISALLEEMELTNQVKFQINRDVITVIKK